MYRRILVPVDLSAKNAPAIAAACELAGANAGEVLLLHVIETLEDDQGLADFYERLAARARERLAALESEVRIRGAAPRSILLLGHRVQRIVEAAKEEKADLLVMGSHRIEPGAPQRDWLTISYRVALLAPCPVLLVK